MSKAMTRAKYDRCIRNVEANLLASLTPIPEAQYELGPQPTGRPQPQLYRTGRTWTLTLAQVAKVQQLKRVDSFQQGTARGYSAEVSRKMKFPKARPHSQRVAKPKATDHRLDVPMKGGVEEMLAVVIAQQEAEAKNAMSDGIRNWLGE